MHPLTAPAARHSRPQLAEYVDLLLQLGEPAAMLRATFLDWHAARLRSQLERVAEQAQRARAEVGAWPDAAEGEHATARSRAATAHLDTAADLGGPGGVGNGDSVGAAGGSAARGAEEGGAGDAAQPDGPLSRLMHVAREVRRLPAQHVTRFAHP